MAKYRVMIIDDDEDIRRMLRLALNGRYEVVEACDGLDALSKLERYEPDFAIIDIMMPLMDGYQVCESIRRNENCRSIPVLFLSAYGSKDNIKRGYAAGANLFMTKPIEPLRVLKNIDFTIEHDPPLLRRKTYSLEQLEEMERSVGGGPVVEVAPGDPAQEKPSPGDSAPPPPPELARDAKPLSARIDPPVNEIRPRVLIVDDDPEIVKMLDLALRDDFEITSASDGMEAIQRIVEYDPDMMIMDIMMPKMNGYQLLQSIRRNRFFKELPVLVLSAKSTPRDRDYAARLGSDVFMAKPYNLQELNLNMEKIVRNPSFKVKRKRLTIDEIHESAFKAEQDQDVKEVVMEQRRKYSEIQKIIDEDRD